MGALFASVVVFSPTTLAADATGSTKISRVEVGFKNHFKVGTWTPIRVAVEGSTTAAKNEIQVTVPDNDAIPTTASASLTTAGSKDDGLVTIYTKVGRIGSVIQLSLVDGERQLDQQTIRPDAKERANSRAIPLPATTELILSIGTTPFGLHEAFPARESGTGQSGRKVVELSRVAELPTEWFGYDAVDVFVISAGNGNLIRDLAADKARLDALMRWVELGGRLVIFCDGQVPTSLFSGGGPLAGFAPGKLAESVRLPETGPLEHFAGSVTPISITPEAVLRIPRFVEVSGIIEVSGTRKTRDLPIVVRSPHGLGEIAFVGLDFSRPPLAEWSGRAGFLQALLRPYLAATGSGDVTQSLVSRGYSDISGALRQQLGRSFDSIVPIGFGVVAALAVTYIALLGPIDYLLISRWLRRPWAAWITFPLIVLAFCGVAFSLGAWRNGGTTLRSNQLELVDIDTIARRARGTLWTTIFTPAASRFDLTVESSARSEFSSQSKEALLSWWGLPGNGIGGMESGGIDLGIVHSGYRYSADRRSLLGVPILASATKSLIARWTSPVSATIDAELTDRDGLVFGSITNRTTIALHNVRLLYGQWAYRLGDLNAGKRVEVNEQISPRKVNTIVTHDALGDLGTSKGTAEGQKFSPDTASAREILSLIMFYDAAGGYAFAHLPNRYLAYCDLSRSLDLGRAILSADATGAVLKTVDDGSRLGSRDKQDESKVVYRFILPVMGRSGP